MCDIYVIKAFWGKTEVLAYKAYETMAPWLDPKEDFKRIG